MAPPPPTPEEEAAALEEAVEPPSVLEVYEEVKREVERHRQFRKEEEERQRAEERLVPRDPTGEAVLEEVGFIVRVTTWYMWPLLVIVLDDNAVAFFIEN